MSSSPLKVCPYCKSMVRIGRFENHVKLKCASRPTSDKQTQKPVHPPANSKAAPRRKSGKGNRKGAYPPGKAKSAIRREISDPPKEPILEAKVAPNNEDLESFIGVTIPPSCRKLRYCSYRHCDNGALVISRSGDVIHVFASLNEAQQWYDALRKHRRLPAERLEYHDGLAYRKSTGLPSQSQEIVSEVVRPRRFSEDADAIHLCESCMKIQAMPGEETCYNCKTE